MSHLYEHIRVKFFYYLNGLSLRSVICCFLTIFLLLLVYELWNFKKNGKQIYFNKVLYDVLVSGYFTFLMSITFLGRTSETINSISTIFSSYSQLIHGNFGVIYDMVFNILLFIPAGILIELKKRNVGFSIFASLGVSLIIEFVQSITGRGLFEISDIINNTLGGVIGTVFVYTIVMFMRKIINKNLNNNRG